MIALILVLCLFSIAITIDGFSNPASSRWLSAKVSNTRSLWLSLSSNIELPSSQLKYSPSFDEEGEGEDEEDEEELSTASTDAVVEVPVAQQISLIKQGLNITTSLNGSDVRVGIIMARWNADIISGLYKGVNESLASCGVKSSNIFTTYVPGAFELPITAKFLAASKRVDVIICLGCLIKGETMHFEYIAQATANGIMQVSLDSFVPVLFGVLTVLNKDQAIKRSTGTHNEGLSWGQSAVEMGLARMSALGLDKPVTAVDKSRDLFSSGSSDGLKKNETKTKKPFGF